MNLIKKNKKLVASLAMIAAAALAAGVALMGIGLAARIAAVAFGTIYLPLRLAVASVGVLVGMLTTLKAVMIALISPIGALALAIAGIGGYFLFTSDAGGKAVNGLKSKLGSLADDAKKSISAIANALKAGDIKLAMEILWDTVNLETAKGLMELRKSFHDYKRDVLIMQEEIINALAKGEVKGESKLRIWLADIWTSFEAASYTIYDYLKEMSLRAITGESPLLKKLTEYDIKSTEEQVNENEDVFSAFKKSLRRSEKKLLSELDKLNEQELTRLTNEGEARKKAIEADLEAKQKELDKRIADANAAAGAGGGDKPKPEPGMDPAKALMDAIEKAAAALEKNIPDVTSRLKGISVRGTFSSFALEQFGGRQSIEKEQVRQLVTLNDLFRSALRRGMKLAFDR